MKILYIDDNRLLTDTVKQLLNKSYIVDVVHTGREGINMAQSIQYSLILLDLGLPDIDGLDVCRELRQSNTHTPILVLSVKKDPNLSAQLLNCGADDYVTKPFHRDVLKARITALLRRAQEIHEEKVITVSDLILNVTKREVKRAGVTIPLRKKEFDILEYLASNHGRALTRNMIFDHVWESGKEGWNNTVDVHIKNLRDKVDRPFQNALIKTAHGIGYMMVDDTA